MYLDFDDRPDVPRVPQAISVREGVLLSIIVHLAFVIFLLVAPAEWFEAQREETAVEPQEPLKFVQVLPLIDKSLLPNPNVDRSDFDLRGAPEPVPMPERPSPIVRGAEEPPSAPPPGSELNETPAPPTPATGMTAPPVPPEPRPPEPAGGSLRDAFRNLGRYIQEPKIGAPVLEEGASGADVEMLDSQGRPIEGIDFGPWLRRFAAQIRRNWLIPQVAETSRGRVVVTFTVLRSGTLLDLQVKQPATIGALTSAAVTALKLSNPTSVLPAEYPDDRVLFTVTFHYNEPIRDRQ
jgi:TonB family protein